MSLSFLLSEEIKAELQQEIPCSQVFLVIPGITGLGGELRIRMGWFGIEMILIPQYHTLTSWQALGLFPEKDGKALLSWGAGSRDHLRVGLGLWGCAELRSCVRLGCDLSYLSKAAAYSAA